MTEEFYVVWIVCLSDVSYCVSGTAKMVREDTKARLQTSIKNKAGYCSLLTFIILLLAWIAGFSSRLFAVIRFESIIHEFDPW